MLKQLNDIFIDLLDDEEIVLTLESSPETVTGWDSLMTIRLIVEIEEKYGVMITEAEMLRIHNVGDIISMIEAKSK